MCVFLVIHFKCSEMPQVQNISLNELKGFGIKYTNIFKNMFIFLNILSLTLARRNMICCGYQGYLLCVCVDKTEK